MCGTARTAMGDFLLGSVLAPNRKVGDGVHFSRLHAEIEVTSSHHAVPEPDESRRFLRVFIDVRSLGSEAVGNFRPPRYFDIDSRIVGCSQNLAGFIIRHRTVPPGAMTRWRHFFSCCLGRMLHEHVKGRNIVLPGVANPQAFGRQRANEALAL